MEKKGETKKKETENTEKKKNFKIIIPCIIVGIIILGIGGYFLYEHLTKIVPEDKFETIAEQNNNYIHYKFEFENVNNNKKEYTIKDYKITFNLNNKEKSGYKINKNQLINTIAKSYDVYYLKNNKSLLVLDVSDFGMGMNIIDKDGIKNVSEFLEGTFSIKNISIKDNNWKFDVVKYSDNYLVVTENGIFNLCIDDYKDYVDDDYVVLETYEYDLSNKKITIDKFKKTPKMTIKELFNNSKNKCDKIDNTDILFNDEIEDDNDNTDKTSEEE